MSMQKSGSCLCGAVQYQISDAPAETGACHCSMCRKWSGGVFLGVKVAADAVRIKGAEKLTVFPSSDWAVRCFCTTCGSSLFYRVTAPGPHQGEYHIGLGTFDDADGLALRGEIFIDQKPSGYAFVNETHKMTGAEVFAMFAPGADVGGE